MSQPFAKCRNNIKDRISKSNIRNPAVIRTLSDRNEVNFISKKQDAIICIFMNCDKILTVYFLANLNLFKKKRKSFRYCLRIFIIFNNFAVITLDLQVKFYIRINKFKFKLI